MAIIQKIIILAESPLEACSMGIELGENDMAFRCNTVTITDNIMESFTAHHIEEKICGKYYKCFKSGISRGKHRVL